MRFMAFTSRNWREMARDPLTSLIAIGLPLMLLLVMSLLGRKLPATVFEPGNFAPGMAVFSLSFISLFSGMLVASDRGSLFLIRLFSSPLTVWDYALGYTLPFLAAAMVQGVLCFALAIGLGLPPTGWVLASLLTLLPTAVLFVGVGLLMGTLFTAKQVSGVGSILVQVATLLGGTWFDLDLIGGTFKTIGYALPFAHAVDATRAALSGQLTAAAHHMPWVLGYAVAILAAAVTVFGRRMKG